MPISDSPAVFHRSLVKESIESAAPQIYRHVTQAVADTAYELEVILS